MLCTTGQRSYKYRGGYATLDILRSSSSRVLPYLNLETLCSSPPVPANADELYIKVGWIGVWVRVHIDDRLSSLLLMGVPLVQFQFSNVVLFGPSEVGLFPAEMTEI